MSSLPTVEQANLQQFWDVVRTLDPELYLVKVALHETGLNPALLPKVVRSVANIAYGTRYGRVSIQIEHGKITFIRGEESDELDQDALVENTKK